MADQKMPTVEVSVIVPCHRADYGLRSTLQALKEQDFDGDFQVVVANDGADPDVSRLADQFGFDCVNSVPGGSSYHARNCALPICTGRAIALTDSNKVPPPDWIRTGLESLQRLGVPYLAGSIGFLPHAVRGQDAAYWHQVYRGFPVEQYLRDQHFGVTGNLLVSRELFESVGLFDDRTFSGGDAEWGRRTFAAGKLQAYRREFRVSMIARSYRELENKGLRQEAGRLRLKQLENYGIRNAIPLRKFVSLLIPPRRLCINREARLQRSVRRDLQVLFVQMRINFALLRFLWDARRSNAIPRHTFYTTT